MDLRRKRTGRFVRLSAQTALREFYEPFFNRAQVLQIIVALVGTWIILQTSDSAETYRQVSGWITGAQALGYVLVGWAFISLVRAPFIVRREERAKGVWRGNNFAYHQPQHVFTRQFFANGLTNTAVVYFPDAEPESFVRYSIEFEPPVANRVSSRMNTHEQQLEDPTVWRAGGRGGIRLSARRTSHLLVRLQDKTVPVICRVYCHSYSIGDDEFIEESEIEVPERTQ